MEVKRYTSKIVAQNNGSVITRLKFTKVIIIRKDGEREVLKNYKHHQLICPINKEEQITFYISELINDKKQSVCKIPLHGNEELGVDVINYKKMFAYLEVCNENGEWHYFRMISVCEKDSRLPLVYIEERNFS